LRQHQADATKMMRILGWAIRLMPFYRLEPHLPQPKGIDLGMGTPPPPTHSTTPTVAPGGVRPAQVPTQRLTDLRPGQELSGQVVKLAPMGAFVDIGVGRDGLVHVSKLREGFVHKAEDVVSVGDTVTVWVEQVELERSRISLTMIDPAGAVPDEVEEPPDFPKPPKPPPEPRPPALQVTSPEQAQPGAWVMGKVTRIESNRILVDIGLADPASLAFAQLEGQPTDPDAVAEQLPAGTEIEARVLRINPKGRIQLALKA